MPSNTKTYKILFQKTKKKVVDFENLWHPVYQKLKAVAGLCLYEIFFYF